MAVLDRKILMMNRNWHKLRPLLLEGCRLTEAAQLAGISYGAAKIHVRRQADALGLARGQGLTARLCARLAEDRKDLVSTGLRGTTLKVAQLRADGESYQQIAHDLGLPVETAKNFMREVYEELGVWHRVELAARYH